MNDRNILQYLNVASSLLLIRSRILRKFLVTDNSLWTRSTIKEHSNLVTQHSNLLPTNRTQLSTRCWYTWFDHAIKVAATNIMEPMLIEEDGVSRFERVISENKDLSDCMHFIAQPSPAKSKKRHFIASAEVDKAVDHWHARSDYHRIHYSASKFLLCMLHSYFGRLHQCHGRKLIPKLSRQHMLPIKEGFPERHFMIIRDFNPRQAQQQFIIVEFAERDKRNKAINVHNYKKLCKTHPRLNHFENFQDFATQFPHPWKLDLHE